ncbi:MAG: hypothetical protein ACJZ15_04105 [Candidatus Neomarinimicrobiota bacterium]
MLSLSKYFLTIFMGISSVFAVPPALNVYVIPFDNSKSEPALMWLSDAFSSMITSNLSDQDRVYTKNQSNLEEVMSNRSLLNQQKPGTKNFLVLGKYERSLDKLIISVQLIDIASWDEVDNRRITGYYNKMDDVNSSLVAMVKTMLSPYLPKPTKSKYPTLTEGRGMQEPPTYAQSAINASSAIDQAIKDLEKKLDISSGAQGEIDPSESREIEGEWVLDFSKEDYENAKPENEMNTVMMVEVLENLMNNPYTVSLDKPKFNYDPQNKKEFQVQLPVNYKLKGGLIKDMLKSLPYSGLKQDGNLTIFYFNKDKYNFPPGISEKIKLGKYRAIPVIQLQNSSGVPLAVLVDSHDKVIQNLDSDRVIFKSFRSFSPLIDFTVGGWSMQVSLETVEIPANYEFKINVNTANSISRVKLKFVPENELYDYLSTLL